MRRSITMLLSAAGMLALHVPGAMTDTGTNSIYQVNKKLAEFPVKEDLSTPESAYAALYRAFVAEGEKAFVRLSVPRLRERIAKGSKRPCPAERVTEYLGAEIVEVHVWNETNAAVIARLPTRSHPEWDKRSLERVNGQWLNCGNEKGRTLDEARRSVAHSRYYDRLQQLRNERPAVAEPTAHLKPFVEFLQREGRAPQAFVLGALAQHRVTILGEVHHRPRYWEFNVALVRAPDFARRAGVIYLELPAHGQPLVEQFLAADHYDPQSVIAMLRDMMEFGWPDQPMLEFFRAVWETNRLLPVASKLRIVLVDMPRPWNKIQRREDWRQYDTDRDQCMADNLLRDLETHAADARHALFIVGYGHAAQNLHLFDSPFQSAGWRLREKLGTGEVFALFPHSPVISNSGRINGRLGLGLLDTALAATGYRPVAFSLEQGPFGDLLYDADPEFLTADPYRNAAHAFLSLGPLEDESFSPLIPGFYTDEFAREVDRRYLVTYGRGLKENAGLKQMDGAAVVAWLGHTWGQPRRDWATLLGPTNAWQYGSRWVEAIRRERHAEAAQHPEEIRAAAQRLFDAIRTADYDRDWERDGAWQEFPAAGIDYTVHRDYPAWVKWVCHKFKASPIREVTLGNVIVNGNELPTLPFTLRLNDGETIGGKLPFQWDARREQWIGQQGLDWHLHSPITIQPKAQRL